MRIIAVCGMPGCGKGEFTGIVKDLGFPVYSMGDVVRFHFRNEFPGRDPIETGIFADMERKKHGSDIWAKRLVQLVDSRLGPGDEIVLIDGLRSRHEKELFRDHWGPDFRVLALHSSPETRFRRLSERGRGDDSPDRKVFDQRDKRELGWGLGDVIAQADRVLVNEGTLEELRSAARSLIDSEVLIG
ncbi:MAG: AAA family ATPase [Thermoplasmatota archaeon]